MTSPKPHCSCEMTHTSFCVYCCFPQWYLQPRFTSLASCTKITEIPSCWSPPSLTADVHFRDASWESFSTSPLLPVLLRCPTVPLNYVPLAAASQTNPTFGKWWHHGTHPEWNPEEHAPLLLFCPFTTFVLTLLECAFALNRQPHQIVCTKNLKGLRIYVILEENPK